jgi:hypothetical protein
VVALYLLSALMAVVAVAFLAVAAHFALARAFPPEGAAAIVAGGAILVAGVAILIRRAPRPKPVRPSRQGRDMSPDTFAAMMRAIQASPTRATALAAIAGMMAGASPELFKGVTEFLDE